MARHLTNLEINTYRGIKNLQLENIGDINILVGDNNSGKTSVLEAIQILCNPSDFENIIVVSRQRDKYKFMSYRYSQSFYDSFLSIFNKEESELRIQISGTSKDKKLQVELIGEIKKILLDVSELNSNNKIPLDEEIDSFAGNLIYYPITLGQAPLFQIIENKAVNYNKYSKVIRVNKSTEKINTNYLSTIDHIIQNTFNSIIKNKEFTNEVLELMKIFDENIIDLRILEDESGRVYQAIDNDKLGYMPISTYGDGIKKVIALAAAIINAKNGILLIDELETAIHPKAMKNVFEFLISACKKRNVQLFTTTHSIEAVEKMLHCQNAELDDIRVIKLYKNEEKTVARSLDGTKALEVKNELGLELR